MSIKIDLMPRYVALERRFRGGMILAGLLLAGTAAVLSLIYVRGQNDLATRQADFREADRIAGLTEDAKKAQANAEAAAAPLQSFVQFVVSASQTGAQRAALLDLVRRYITPDAIISQIDMSDGQTAKITATLRSPDDYARFLLNLRAGSETRGGQLFAGDPKSFSVIPQNSLPGTGFTQPFVLPARAAVPQNVTYPITMTVIGKLKDPIVVPADPGTPAPVAASTGPNTSGRPVGAPSQSNASGG